MNRYIIFLLFLVSSFSLKAQSGDQMLDGIGETALIARYSLDGNAKDWSRNNRHAKFHGSEALFVVDEQFGKLISFSSKNFISLPTEVLEGHESLSIGFWMFLSNTKKEQGLLDFRSPQGSLFSITNMDAGISIHMNTGTTVYKASPGNALTAGWHYITVVLNSPTKTIDLYCDGNLADELKGVDMDLRKLFRKRSENQLTIGRTDDKQEGASALKLYDFRFYSIALSEFQIERIIAGALHQDIEAVSDEEDKDEAAEFAKGTPQFYNPFLLSVSDVEVETTIGTLPRLPRYIDGSYADGLQGAQVRVLWPSPKDNRAVSEEGSYTLTGLIPGSELQPVAKVRVMAEKAATNPSRKLLPFTLNQVSLDVDTHNEKTKFIENRDKFLAGLRPSNPDDFLYMFRNAYGQEQPEGARALGVWDSQETKLRGHATGHYLSALAQAFASTGYDKELQSLFAEKMTYMVEVLFELSQLSGTPQSEGEQFMADPAAVLSRSGDTLYDSDLSVENIRTDYWNWGKGFISAYAPDQFIMLEYGAKYGTDNTKIWAPYYTLHKILAGLLDIYKITGNEKALAIVEGMGDWVYARLSQLPKETLTSMWNLYIAGEFGGMNDAMACLSRLAKDERYLECAQLFDNTRLFFGDAAHSHGLAKNVDMFRGLHANQHIPQIIEALEIYRALDDKAYFDIAANFWHKATNDYMYSIGGVAGASNPANAECFTKEPATLFKNDFSKGGQNETCATYNLLKLSRNLFFYHQDAELMDYYERGLYNHILASVDEHTPANTYHVPLRPGSVKHFGNPDMHGFTCCNGTALESHTKLQNSIYFKSKDDKELYVNLYVPSTLKWKKMGIELEQSTAFPKDDKTRLRIKGKGKFDLKVRVPQWATAGFFVSINGEKQEIKASPGTYLTLTRKWKDGDVVEL